MTDGLEGIVAVHTVLSDVDGENGQLILRGHRLDDIAGRLSFEAVIDLLWKDIVPEATQGSAGEFGAALGALRRDAYERMTPLLPYARHLTVIEGLRFLLSVLGDDETPTPGLFVTAATPVFTAALSRAKASLPPIAPDPSAGHAADFLHMLRGKRAGEDRIRALDAYWVTVIDHGMNASTFAGRVIASTRAGVVSSIVGALCALKGPLHGGAPGPVLDMFDAIGDPENADAWIRDTLAKGERLMGFGHRIYKVRDPRADVLKKAARSLKGAENRIPFAEQIEEKVLAYLEVHKPGRRLETNVEYYTAIVLDALGIPRDAFTPVFACARVAGWVAHAYEQIAEGRLIRPLSAYTGPAVPVQSESDVAPETEPVTA